MLTLVPSRPPNKKLEGWSPSGLDRILAFEKRRLEGLARQALEVKQGERPQVVRSFSHPDQARALDPPPAVLPSLTGLRPPFPANAEFDGGARLQGRAVGVFLLPGDRGERLFVDPESGLPLGTAWTPQLGQSEVRLLVTAWQATPVGLWPRRITWHRQDKVLLTEEVQVKKPRRTL